MKKSGIVMIMGSALLLGLFFMPLWNIHLKAPQYKEGLGMDIYIDDIVGESEFDIAKIDMLNHYIGMKTIPKPEDMWEMTVFPLVVGGMAFIGIIIGILGFLKKLPPISYLIWFVVMSALGLLGMNDFNNWLADYGKNLNPNAAIKLLDVNGNLMTYKPPLFGYQKMLNFDVWSYPQTGAYFMFAGMLLVLVAFYIGYSAKRSKA